MRHQQAAMRSDARTLSWLISLHTITRVIIIVITMATVITIVIAWQTLTSPPLPHPVPFGGQFGISQPLYPALAHFITRSCQIQSSSHCFDRHRSVARCHYRHQYHTIVVTVPIPHHARSWLFNYVLKQWHLSRVVNHKWQGDIFKAGVSEVIITLSFASDPTIMTKQNYQTSQNDNVNLILSSAGAQQHHQTLHENDMIFYN